MVLLGDHMAFNLGEIINTANDNLSSSRNFSSVLQSICFLLAVISIGVGAIFGLEYANFAAAIPLAILTIAAIGIIKSVIDSHHTKESVYMSPVFPLTLVCIVSVGSMLNEAAVNLIFKTNAIDAQLLAESALGLSSAYLNTISILYRMAIASFMAIQLVSMICIMIIGWHIDWTSDQAISQTMTPRAPSLEPKASISSGLALGTKHEAQGNLAPPTAAEKIEYSDLE